MTHPIALLTTANGQPALIEATVRESQTAPGRLKVGFAAPVDQGIGVRHPQTGEVDALAPPQTNVDPAPVCLEFRLEMN